MSLDCSSAFSTDDRYELRVFMDATGLLVKARAMRNDYSYISSEDGRCCVKCSVRVYGKP